MSSVGMEFPVEQARVRDLRDQYLAIGPAGAIGAQLMRAALTEAEQAQASGDVVRILRAFQMLKEFTE